MGGGLGLRPFTSLNRGEIMALMKAVAKCFVNNQMYEAGEEFEYDGPAGSAFHKIGATPNPELNFDDAINAMPSLSRLDADNQKTNKTQPAEVNPPNKEARSAKSIRR